MGRIKKFVKEQNSVEDLDREVAKKKGDVVLRTSAEVPAELSGLVITPPKKKIKRKTAPKVVEVGRKKKKSDPF